jgi:hypothetical protein
MYYLLRISYESAYYEQICGLFGNIIFTQIFMAYLLRWSVCYLFPKGASQHKDE